MKLLTGLVGLVLTLAVGATAWAQGQVAEVMPHPGQAIYRLNCAACHDNPEATRSPARATLSAMSYQTLSFALTQGKMQAQGAALDDETRGQLINYLTGRASESRETWSQTMACSAQRPGSVARTSASVATFGFDARQTRTLTARQAGLTKSDLGKLELAWAIGFPNVTMMRAQPAGFTS